MSCSGHSESTTVIPVDESPLRGKSRGSQGPQTLSDSGVTLGGSQHSGASAELVACPKGSSQQSVCCGG